MSVSEQTSDESHREFEIDKDTSVSDAKWMFACVAFLAGVVLMLGFVAEMLVGA